MYHIGEIEEVPEGVGPSDASKADPSFGRMQRRHAALMREMSARRN